MCRTPSCAPSKPSLHGRQLRCGSESRVLRRFQRLLSEQRDQVAGLICREAGKPAVEALTTEVLVVLDATEFCIRNAHDFLREEPLPHGNLAMKTKRGKLLREPFGVIGIISPWNYPFSIAATETLGALVTGNAVVLKPSEFTPLIALELQRLLLAAGLNPDLMQVVIGEGPAGAALIDVAHRQADLHRQRCDRQARG